MKIIGTILIFISAASTFYFFGWIGIEFLLIGTIGVILYICGFINNV